MQRLTILPIIISVFLTNMLSGQSRISFETLSGRNRTELVQKFSKSQIASFNPEQLFNDLKTDGASIIIEFDGLILEFSLKENSVISPQYRSISGSDEPNRNNSSGTVKTMDGILKNKSGYITLTTDVDFFSAMITIGGSVFMIEQSNILHQFPDKGELVLYDAKDVIPDGIHTCGVDDMSYIEPDFEERIEERQVGQCLVVELAIASDASMYQKYGNSTTTVQNRNIAIINNVAFNYRHEFLENIEFQIVAQYVSTTFANDPLSPNTSSLDPGVVLPAFRTWGNNNGFQGVVFDEALLWTNRDFEETTVGLAYVGVICNTSRYLILQDYTTDAQSLRVLTAHEMGHNFAANHDGSGTPFIMAPSVNNTNAWSPASVTSISNHITSRNCLSACNGPVIAGFVSTPGALCNSGTVLYKDKSVNNGTRSWSFPGGSPSSSTSQQQQVTYNNTGVFSATIVANGNTFTVQNAVTVDAPTPFNISGCALPSGTPGTAGVQNVSLADMFSDSGNGATDGSKYVDRSCTDIASLSTNTSYTIRIGLGNCGTSLFERVRMYIDYNNNGSFEAGELEVNTGGQGFCGFNSFTFTTSANPVQNQLLRMRILSSTTAINGPCENPANGQVEDFSVIFKSQVPLPLDLITFRGKSTAGYNELQWQTKNEIDLERFVVERSYDGINFMDIGYVTPTNTSRGADYSFTDDDLQGRNKWYYRLRNEDVSGYTSISNVIFLSSNKNAFYLEKLTTVIPSDRPVTFQLFSNQSQQVDIALFDMMGNQRIKLNNVISEGQNNMEIELPGLSKGMFIMVVKNDRGDELVNKIIVE